MEIGKLEVTIENNLFEIIKEDKNKEWVSFTLDGKELANQ